MKYEGAILSEEELQNIIIIGIPLVKWDVDMNTIMDCRPTGLVRSPKGKLVHFRDVKETLYLKWFGIPDPTYNRTEVLWSLPDDQIGKAEAEHASLYLFNTHEEAEAARTLYKEEQKRRYQEYMKARKT